MALGSIDIRRYLLQNWDADVCGVFYSDVDDVDDQWFIGFNDFIIDVIGNEL